MTTKKPRTSATTNRARKTGTSRTVPESRARPPKARPRKARTAAAKTTEPKATKSEAREPKATKSEAREPKATKSEVQPATATPAPTPAPMPQADVQSVKEVVEESVAAAQQQASEATENVVETYESASIATRQALNAYVASGTIVARGWEMMGREMMSFAQASIESNVALTKALLGARSLNDIVTIETDYGRAQFDSALSQSAKLTNLSVKVMNEAMQPLQIPFGARVERFFTSAG